MLLVDHPDGKFAVAQPAHAFISGQLARAWAGELHPRDEVCLAAEQHDMPWLEWERDPSYDPRTGYPHTFMSLDMPAKLALWADGPDALVAQSRYAALLVSMHGSRLYEDLERGAFERAIRATLDAPDEEIERNHRLIGLWDGLSLAILLDWAPWSAEGVTLQPGGVVAPWPFATESLTVRCDGRLLREPGMPLDQAQWVDLTYELRQ
jgi:hypothetical protein